jgi:predicted metal-dependent HD superfamily phosphohydrolase
MTKHYLTDILNESILDLRCRRLHPVDVAIVDSGIDSTHELLRHRIFGAWEYVETQDKKGITRILEKKLPKFGNNASSDHGTAVASIISRIAGNARLLDYKTLGPYGTSTNKIMIAGLKAAIEGNAKIINMSLVCESKYRHEIEDLCEIAYQKHKIIVASKRNKPRPGDLGFPAQLATCISVDNIDYVNNPFEIEHIDMQPIEFAALGEKVLVATNNGGYCRQSGASFAVPTVTGFIALLLGRYPDLELFEIKSILKYHSQRGTFRKLNIINPLEISEHVIKKNSHSSVGYYICPKCRNAVYGDDVFSYMKCPSCSHIFALFSDMDRKLFQTVITVLSSNVPKDCLYHNVQHTREVVSNTYAFMRRYPCISTINRKCLMAAALLHDYGYVESYKENEPISAQYAADLLPQYGYKKEEIELVKSLILATALPVTPKTLLEKILCDADLGHIGLDQYREKTELLRKEREVHGFHLSKVEWLKGEIYFLSKHHFFQKWLETERREPRKQTIEKLTNMLNDCKKRLKENT